MKRVIFEKISMGQILKRTTSCIVREVVCITCFSFLYVWSYVPRSCYLIEDVSNHFALLWILQSINIRIINGILILYDLFRSLLLYVLLYQDTGNIIPNYNAFALGFP